MCVFVCVGETEAHPSVTDPIETNVTSRTRRRQRKSSEKSLHSRNFHALVLETHALHTSIAGPISLYDYPKHKDCGRIEQ